MALAQRKSTAWTRRHTQDGPTLNTYDVPEMMLGAQPAANSVERERFNRRCKKLWEEEDRQASEAAEVIQHSNAMKRFSQLQTMFSDLDPELIWNNLPEIQNMQEAVDTLLAFSRSMSVDAGISARADTEGGANMSGATAPVDIATQQQSSKEVVPGNAAGTWPALMDSDGWEVVNYQALQQHDQDLGSAWCKTAKDAAHLPAPRPSRSTAAQSKQKQRESHVSMEALECIEEDGLLTDYEMRQMRGQMRANKLAIKAVAREAHQAFNNALEQKEQLATESASSCGTLSESEIQSI